MKKWLWPLYVASFLGVLVGDQLTKMIIVQNEVHGYDLLPFLSYELTYNTGVSWSLFSYPATPWWLYVLIGITLLLLMSYMIMRVRESKMIFAEIIIFAGALSNSIDRFTYGGVVDFISLHWGSYYFPFFNVADIAITCGIAGMLYTLIREDYGR